MSRWFRVQREMNKHSFVVNDLLLANMEFLCYNYGDRVREAVGIPVVITSGYRTVESNKAAGGSPTSRHLLGLAHDLTWRGIHEGWVKKIALKIRDQIDEANYQFIWYPGKNFVHLGLAKPGRSTEFLISLDNGLQRFDIDT